MLFNVQRGECQLYSGLENKYKSETRRRMYHSSDLNKPSSDYLYVVQFEFLHCSMFAHFSDFLGLRSWLAGKTDWLIVGVYVQPAIF